MCKMFKKLHPKWITGYHEHDSLLEHRFAEELTEEEQKKAWENYEAKKTESVDYVTAATLMSQLHQHQNSMQPTDGVLSNIPHSSSNVSNQPVAMPYMNQPQPPGTTEQGIDKVIGMAFRHCQELTKLHRVIREISIELMKPKVAKDAKDALRETQQKNIKSFRESYQFLQESLKLVSTTIKAYAAYPAYQAKLAATKQFIFNTLRQASNMNM